eukprot:scaffold286796_cov32-Tisochrysis_lutea.AAC.1
MEITPVTGARIQIQIVVIYNNSKQQANTLRAIHNYPPRPWPWPWQGGEGELATRGRHRERGKGRRAAP